MTANNDPRAVGREGMVRSNGLEISVIIRDVRPRASYFDFLIEPTAGQGMIWIESDKVLIVG